MSFCNFFSPPDIHLLKKVYSITQDIPANKMNTHIII